MNWGIVAKIPVAEIRKHYINAAIIVFILSVLFITICTLLLIKITNPLLSLALEHKKELLLANKELTIAKEQAETNQQFNNTLLKTMPFGIDIVTTQGDLLYINEVLRNLCGEHALNKKCWEVFRDDHTQCEDCPLKDDIKIGKTKICQSIGAFGGKTFEISHTGLHYNGQKVLLEIFIDISERKQKEFELISAREKAEENEEKYKLIFNSTGTSNSIFDAQCILRQQNKQSIEFLGKDGVGLSVFELFGEEAGKAIFDRMQKVFLTGNMEVFESEFNLKTGKKWFRSSYLPMLKEKKVIAIQVISQNISEIKSAELAIIAAKEKAEENEIRFQMAQRFSKAGTWDWNIQENVFYWSHEFLEIFGIPTGIIPGFEIWKNALHPDDYEKASEKIQSSIDNKTPLFSDYRIIKNNEIRWIRALGDTIYVKNIPIRMLGICIDITEQKLSEVAIRESEENLNLSQKIAHIGSYITDLKTGIWRISDEMYSVLGIDKPYPHNLDGFTNLVHPDSLDDFIKYHNIVEQERLPFDYEYKIIRQNDKMTRWVHGLGEIEYDNEGIVLFRKGTIQDITERKQIEIDLIAAKEKAEESDRLKTAFLQNMSHEIRTPMNAIMGFAELIPRNFNDKPKLENFSKIINQRCSDLLTIINDLLDIAKIESGQLTVNFERCNLTKLFFELKQFFIEHQERINKNHISFDIVSHCQYLDISISTDTVKLKQIFINLLSNAFKFTQNGHITAGCHSLNDNELVFYVSDTGMGIPDDKYQYIFERFSQLEFKETRLYGGTGLGLPIVKGLVTLLGGNVWLESEQGKGTTFYFSIDYKKHVTQETLFQTQTYTEDIISFNEKTVLIVEDDTYNSTLLNEMLSNIGLNLIFADNGSSAIQQAKENKPDLVLMDIGLPDMMGYEATRIILEQNPGLKVIAQTAYASSADKETALNSGCIDHISKPIKLKTLLSLLNKHLS